MVFREADKRVAMAARVMSPAESMVSVASRPRKTVKKKVREFFRLIACQYTGADLIVTLFRDKTSILGLLESREILILLSRVLEKSRCI